MLQENNDNLLNADGNDNQTSTNENLSTPQQNLTDENIVTISEEALNNDEMIVEKATEAMQEIANMNAEENEEDGITNLEEIEIIDYDALSMDQLVNELEKLASSEKVMSVKNLVDDLKRSFISKYNHFIEEKKADFYKENPDSTEDFQYHLPLKQKFDTLLNQYRDKKTSHFKKLETTLKQNLENRLAIVEELKSLINPEVNFKETLKQFNDIKDRWKNAGAIPKDKYNIVWNNYHFHLEKFYDYLHLDRETRDIEFKNNLELKLKIIARLEDLVNESNINKAHKELQGLHKIWKEDIGPVASEFREELWSKLSSLTKQIYDRKQEYLQSQKGKELENLENKKQIVSQIINLSKESKNSHNDWQSQVKLVEELRAKFFTIGKVPTEFNETVWTDFKNATRDFNNSKNNFYKEIKSEQNQNLILKQQLIQKAKELSETDDFQTNTPIIKKLQEDWKNVGHVPRKDADKTWKEFRAHCNKFFDRLKESKSGENEIELQNYQSKKDYLEELRKFELSGEHREDLDAIKKHIENWKALGKVPVNKRNIEGKYNKVLDVLFEKLSTSKRDSEMLRFNNRIEQLAGSDDSRKIVNEKLFINRKIEEIKNEINQLENNILFFTNSKNGNKENPIVIEVRKSIEKHKDSLQLWKDKLTQLNELDS